jgi:SAM-dependent methyltransferase
LTRLPRDFLTAVRALEDAYLQSDDPIRRSGFGGGAERWRAEREPILDAIDGDGDLLDIGCANGYLLRCLVDWGLERGLRLTPHGIDIGPRLIELARAMHPENAANFHVANAWDWRPARRFRYVYTLYDNVPETLLAPYLRRLLDRVVEPGGRLIVGAYGSRSRGTPPFAIAEFLAEEGYRLAGHTTVGDPTIVAFAWLDKVG